MVFAFLQDHQAYPRQALLDLQAQMDHVGHQGGRVHPVSEDLRGLPVTAIPLNVLEFHTMEEDTRVSISVIGNRAEHLAH